jgi:hypothetical protein
MPGATLPLGSKAEIGAMLISVRFTPESGRGRDLDVRFVPISDVTRFDGRLSTDLIA